MSLKSEAIKNCIEKYQDEYLENPENVCEKMENEIRDILRHYEFVLKKVDDLYILSWYEYKEKITLITWKMGEKEKQN
jgi:hypothetical protein